jgi:hypothetical protein
MKRIRAENIKKRVASLEPSEMAEFGLGELEVAMDER